MRLFAIVLTTLVNSSQTPLTSLTSAWAPRIPSVPTCLATRVTSFENVPRRSTISLMVVLMEATSAKRGVKVIRCERSPVDTDLVTVEISLRART